MTMAVLPDLVALGFWGGLAGTTTDLLFDSPINTGCVAVTEIGIFYVLKNENYHFY